MITDADRLVWLVRRMSAAEVARVFRDGLPAGRSTPKPADWGDRTGHPSMSAGLSDTALAGG